MRVDAARAGSPTKSFSSITAANRLPGERLLRIALAHELGGVAADGGVGVEVGVEGAADLVEVEERLAEHGQLGRDADAALARTCVASISTMRPTWIWPTLRVLVLGHEVGHVAPESRLVEVRRIVAQADGHRGRLVRPPLAHREEQAQQPLLHGRA